MVFQSREGLNRCVARRVAMLVAQRVRGPIAVFAIDRHFSARDAVALGDLAGDAGTALRRVRSVRRTCWGKGHGAFPFRDDAAAGRTPTLS